MAQPLTPEERQLLTDVQDTTSKLAKLVQAAIAAGFNVQFSMNSNTGIVDKFEVTRAVPVDFTAGTN
jgi:hypothetical protein